MDNSSHKTQDHQTIKQWAEERGGRPAIVKGTEELGEGSGLLRIKFEDSEDLEEIDWEKFFDTFDDRELTFLYQENLSDNQESRFFKFIRES